MPHPFGWGILFLDLTMVQPPFLQPGDAIGIVAPANQLSISSIKKAATIIESWGLEVLLGKSVYDKHHQFAGPDQARLLDLQSMMDDLRVKAIFCARGGYGTSRILDELDFSKFRTNPKWLIGFSDITALLCQLYRLGIKSVHGTMPILFEKKGYEEANTSLKNLLFGGRCKLLVPAHSLNRIGESSGLVVGGNLTILTHLLGTRSEIDTTNTLLFLEEVGEYLYNLDRMMVQLKRAGKLKDLAGMVIGSISKSKDNDIPFGQSPYEIVLGHLKEYAYPVAFDFPIGHTEHNIAIPIGSMGRLKVDESEAVLHFED